MWPEVVAVMARTGSYRSGSPQEILHRQPPTATPIGAGGSQLTPGPDPGFRRPSRRCAAIAPTLNADIDRLAGGAEFAARRLLGPDQAGPGTSTCAGSTSSTRPAAGWITAATFSAMPVGRHS